MTSFHSLQGIWRRLKGREGTGGSHRVGQILDLQQSLRPLGDRELRQASLSLRYQVLSGEHPSRLLPQAFALVREAARRRLGMEHYEVQLLGGMVLHDRGVAVMQTGEGKTLTATLPLYLAALSARGAHLATANDYLAARDARMLTPLFDALGLTIGTVSAESTPRERATAYACDLTYTTAKELGFDFLRDRILRRRLTAESPAGLPLWTQAHSPVSADSGVQRELYFCLVDEADSILIDEARTPLVVSSTPANLESPRASLYRWCAAHASSFSEPQHYSLDSRSRRVRLTPAGRELLRRLPQPASLDGIPQAALYEQLELAIVVDRYYLRDRHYIVRDGEVVIVDEFTGRLAEGRKWRAGLHQAIEAREQLRVTSETGEAARITIQDLFLSYEYLAGMTGTVANSGPELEKIYRLSVHAIPTHRPPCRQAWPDRVFPDATAKWKAIADETEAVHRTGRPVLIGTRSIDKSECLSELLTRRGIAHEVLNANELAREAEVISSAGQVGRVTVATNMAGRGTDIQLDEAARRLGGLHVICSELHESSRIDRQLIGRCGRQGDPGTFRQFLSLDDELLSQALPAREFRRLQKSARRIGRELDGLASRFRAAQRTIEQRHFAARKLLMYHERQRQQIQREMGLDPYLDAPT